MTTLSPTALSGLERRIAMSRSGRWLLHARGGDVDLVDLLGAMPLRTLPAIEGPVELVGRYVWGFDGHALTRIAPEDLRVLPGRAIVPGRPRGLLPGVGAASAAAPVAGWLGRTAELTRLRPRLMRRDSRNSCVARRDSSSGNSARISRIHIDATKQRNQNKQRKMI
jgi:hypothetical protein